MLPLLLAGCLAPSDTIAAGDRADGADTADAADAADCADCADGADGADCLISGRIVGQSAPARPVHSQIEGLTLIPAERIPTVLVATWSSARDCQGTASFGLADEPWLSAAEPEPTREHSLILVGMPSESDVEARITCAATDGTAISAEIGAHTGSLPDRIVNFALTGTPDPNGGFLTLPLLESTETATLMDMKGRIVWFWTEQTGANGSRVRLSVDGKSILYNVQDQTPGGTRGTGGIIRVGLDGSWSERVSVPGQSHDYVELPDGTLASIAADIRTEDGVSWNGDRLLEVAPDGTEREIWSAWDTWTVAEAPPDHAEGNSWTHANALDYDPGTDTYWMGVRNLSAIVHIDRASGDVLDQLGGPTPTWAFSADSVPTDGQHQFEVQGDSILVFDNQFTSRQSREVEFLFDADSHTLQQRWTITPADGGFNQAFGDVARSADGGTRVTYATPGVIEAYDAAGQVEWSLSAPPTMWIGYSEHLASLE